MIYTLIYMAIIYRNIAAIAVGAMLSVALPASTKKRPKMALSSHYTTLYQKSQENHPFSPLRRAFFRGKIAKIIYY